MSYDSEDEDAIMQALNEADAEEYSGSGSIELSDEEEEEFSSGESWHPDQTPESDTTYDEPEFFADKCIELMNFFVDKYNVSKDDSFFRALFDAMNNCRDEYNNELLMGSVSKRD